MPSEQTLVEQKVFSFPFSSPPSLDFFRLIIPPLGWVQYTKNDGVGQEKNPRIWGMAWEADQMFARDFLLVSKEMGIPPLKREALPG
jgi:hypothetical protein